jgi:hypothetical protein
MTKISFREATRADVAAINALHVEQSRIQGTNFEGPPFDGSCIIDAVVGESDGQIVGLYYCEAVAELRFVAIDPRFTAAAQREVERLAERLRSKGLRWLEVFVPRKLVKMIGKPLRRAGFECVDQDLAHFTRDLR